MNYYFLNIIKFLKVVPHDIFQPGPMPCHKKGQIIRYFQRLIDLYTVIRVLRGSLYDVIENPFDKT